MIFWDVSKNNISKMHTTINKRLENTNIYKNLQDKKKFNSQLNNNFGILLVRNVKFIRSMVFQLIYFGQIHKNNIKKANKNKYTLVSCKQNAKTSNN